MAKNPPKPADLGLDAFQQPPDEGLSLDSLSQAFAAMLNNGSDPYSAPTEVPPANDATATSRGPAPANVADAAALPPLDWPDENKSDEHCEISPRTILEAMLFVDSPGGQPLTSQQVASLMRGVRPGEIDELVRDLNASYLDANCPYAIESAGAGYRLTLRPEFSLVREQFYGRVKQAKLSPAAVEVLAAVAYHEPLTADEVSKLRGAASGSVLAQLVRRELLRIDRPATDPKVPRYFTTPRFLQLFGLKTLADLPSSQEEEG